MPRAKVYWTWSDSEGRSGVSRSSLEGADVVELTAGDLFYEDYRGVALDPGGDKIYWTTLFKPPPIANPWVGVFRADLDGSKAEELAVLHGWDRWDLPSFMVRQFGFAGDSFALGLSHKTQVSAGSSVPLSSTLRSSYPNPFNASTLISYSIAVPGPVTLVVYNTLGQPVQTLVDRIQPPGLYSVPWQPAEAIASGVYLYRLTTSDAVLTRRLALLR